MTTRHFPIRRPSSACMLGVVLAASLASPAAQADGFLLSGRLGTTVYTGPLNGGSFQGTFDFTRPAIGSFAIQLFDAGNNLRFTLNNANSTATFQPNFGGAGYDAIQFVTTGSQLVATILSLDFALGFTGAGTVIPYPAGFPYSSFATLGGQTSTTTSTVISGISVAVPEPATWAFFGLGLAALAGRRLRQRAAAA